MKKVKVTLPTNKWGSLNTKYRPYSIEVGDNEFTGDSKNFITDENGSIVKAPGGVDYNATPLAAAIKDQHEAVFSDGSRLLLVMANGTLYASSGGGDFDTVAAGYTASANMEFATYNDRVYFGNGIDTPQVGDKTTAYGGVTYLPVTFTVIDYSALGGKSVTVAGTTKTEGVNWTAATDNAATATSLAAAIDAISGVSASANGAVVTVYADAQTAAASTSDATNLPMTAVDYLRVADMGVTAPASGPTAAAATYTPATVTVVDYTQLSGAVVTVAGVAFTEGVDWTAGVSNNNTAASLQAAIDASGSFTASVNGAVVTVTVDAAPGVIATSSQTYLPLAGSADEVEAGSYYYKVTFLYRDAEESNGSPASAVVSPAILSQINLTGIATGGYGVTARKIYRSDDGVVYRLVGTISDNTTTTFTDNESIGTTIIPSDRTSIPVFGLILAHKDRLFLGKVSGEVSRIYTTEAGLPNVVRTTGFILCNSRDPITGLYEFNDKPVVFNRASFGQILGTTSDTYRYSGVPGNVGCVDNRTIQVRVVRGIPVLIWMAEKNIYQWNGATVDVASDRIEPLLNANIQQAQQVKGSATDTTRADFQAGTASGGIDLTTTPGTVTTKNPTRVWQTEADWEGGSDLSNVVSNGTSNTIKAPVKFAPDYEDGTVSGSAALDGTDLTLSVGTDLIGGSATASSGSGPFNAGAFRIVLPREGLIASATIKFYSQGSAGLGYLKIYTDSGGTPNTVLYTSPAISTAPALSPATAANTIVAAPNLYVAAGTYWIGWEGTGGGSTFFLADNAVTSTYPGGNALAYRRGASWAATVGSIHGGAFSFVQTAVPASGTYTSEVHDTGSDNVAGTLTLSHTGTYPASTSATTTLDASTNGSTWVSVLATANQNGEQTVALSASSGYRYFRVREALTTTDDRNVPVLGAVTLKFAVTAVWTSEEIDCTADVSAYDSLTAVTTTPTGTSVTIEASSSDTSGSGYSGWAALGSTAVKRYFRARLTVAADTVDEVTATVTRLTFNYQIAATLISATVDTANTPAGWDVFQAVSAANGGTLALHMRTASAPGGLAAAPWVAVSNGVFPTVDVNRYAQWRVSITSTAGKVPTLSSVTLNWFISVVASVRAASLFYNRTYYLSVAEYGEDTNNLILSLDGDNNWRVRREVAAATMGTFFNDPYYGSAEEGTFVRWLTGTTERGENITMDVYTKAFDFGDLSRRKVLLSLVVSGAKTGATFTVTYTPDNGANFYPMVDNDGNAAFTVAASGGAPFIRRLKPRASDPHYGATLQWRIVSEDSNRAEIHELTPTVLIREGTILDA